ncbi:MAG TPA: hypothetical protein VKK81_25165 [Candidatus Binatia bacterium]|nr:hypothetical protein [Candidatus Binatia bacterium]
MKRFVVALSLDLVLLFSGWCGTAAAQTPARVSVRLLDTLTSENSKAGDRFTATLVEPLVMNGRIVARKDTRVTGQVREAISSGRLKRPALLTLSLTGVQSRSGQYPIATGDLTVKADSHATRNVLIIGGSSGAGAAIGGAAGGGKGAAIGAVIGAGAGTAGAYLTGKREIVLPSETLLMFHVTSVTISAKELSWLQRAGPEAHSGQRTIDAHGSDAHTVVVRRYRYDDDDDDDDQGEDEHEHRLDRPRRIDVVFLGDHHAGVVIRWPRRTERLTLRGDDLDDILEPLSDHTKLPVEVLRVKVKFQRQD